MNRNDAFEALRVGAQVLLSAMLWFVLIGIVGVGLIVVGVFVIFGLGWSLLIGGVLCILLAAFISRGMSGG